MGAKSYLATVITPFFDEPIELLTRNIESVRKQKVPEGTKVQHIIIVDKGADEYQDMEVKYLLEGFEIPFKEPYELMFFHLDRNRGLPTARNEGLKRAKGEFIFLLDTDDVMAGEDRIIKQIGFMIDKGLDHSYGAYQPIHGNAKQPSPEVIVPAEDMVEELKKMVNPCFCGSNCFKKSVLSKVGDFDSTMLDGAEDAEFWVRIAKDPELKSASFGNEPLYYLGVHGNNMTARYVAEKRFEKAFDYMKKKHAGFFV